MAIVVNTNIASINAQRNLVGTGKLLQRSLQRLSSGLRINSAKDDAAGLAISDRMNAQVRGLNQAVRNANDGISLAQTAEGAMQETTNILQRMRELAVQSANDTNTATDRSNLQKEITQLQAEIDRIATTTAFNGKTLLNGTFTAAKFHVGANENQYISFSIGSTKASDIGNNTVGINGTLNQATAAADSAPGNGVADGEDLTIVGSLGTATYDVSADETAKSIAEGINATTKDSGVSATAITKAKLSSVSASGQVSFKLYGKNSTAATISVNVASTSDLSGLADAINKVASTTGISAEANGGELTLVSSEGYDIKIEDWGVDSGGDDIDVSVQGLKADGSNAGSAVTLQGDGSAGAGADSTTIGGSITFQSAESFTVTAGATGALFTSTNANASTLSAVGSIDIGTQEGANSAISVIDGALQFIDNTRADLGAIQNRFESTIANLMNVSENISAAKSRILDADFAAETANLTKAQILQQAGTAMLAQANTVPQAALTLLQG